MTGYIMEKKEGPRHTYVHVSKTMSEETSLTILGLNEGKDYYFRVYAENKYGRSSALESKEPATPKRTLGKLTFFVIFSEYFFIYTYYTR